MKNSVTQEQVDGAIKTVAYHKLGEKTCVGLATLHNGFEICMSSSCVDAENYDQDVGAALVLHKIKDKVWELLGYQLQSLVSGAEATFNKLEGAIDGLNEMISKEKLEEASAQIS